MPRQPGCFSDLRKWGNALAGAAIGSSIGATLGVHIKGREFRLKQPIWKTATGGILGGIAGYLLAKPSFGLSLLFLPPTAAATAFFL